MVSYSNRIIVVFSIIALLKNLCADGRRQVNATDIVSCNGTFAATNCTKIDDSGTSLTTKELQPTFPPPFPTRENPLVNRTSSASVTGSFVTPPPFTNSNGDNIGTPPPCTNGNGDNFDTPPPFTNGNDDNFSTPPSFSPFLPFDTTTSDGWVNSDYEWTVTNSTEVDAFIDGQDAREYIASFEDEFQRMLIEETLRICPYIVLCNFTLGFVPPPYSYRMFYGDLCCSPCSCQSDCVSAGTCCPDYRSLPLDQVARNPSTEVTETCMPMFIRQHPMTFEQHDFIVKAYQDCPPNTDVNLHIRCAGSFASFSSITLVDVTPLTDNVTMKTYRNQHCAVCNGVDITKLIPWTPRMDCWLVPSFKSETELLSGIINGTQPCVINLWAPDTDLNYCDEVITSCNETGSWVEYDPVVRKACGLYETMVGVTRDMVTWYFKNPYCAICNGMTPSLYICPANQGEPGNPYAFSGLLRLGSSDVQDDSEDSLNTCGPGRLFDDVKNRCRNVTCAFHQTFKDGRCESFLSSSDSVGYRVFAVVRPSVDISVVDVYDIMPAVKEKYEKMVEKFSDGSICTGQTMIVSTISPSVQETGMLIDHVEFLNNVIPYGNVPIYMTVAGLLRLDGRNITVEHSRLGTIVFNVYLKDDPSVYNTRIAYSRFDNWTLAGDPIPLRGMFEESFADNDKLIIPYFEWNDNPGTCFIPGVFHRLLTMRSCPMFSVNKTEFGLIETPFGLQLEDGKDVIMNLSDYVINDDENTFIRMCVDTYSRIFKTVATKVAVVYSTELIVSIIAVSVSIICLTISLFSYCLLPQLQTLPGKNNMALIVSLLLAQGTYLLSSYGSFETDSFLCKLVGGLTHFFWLLAIFWMNICTFHMFRVLVRTRNVSSMARSKKYILYHLYSIVMSGIFIAINVIVSMVTSGYSDYGYGNTRCYVSTQRMLEITLGIPAAIVVVANLSMFVTIIVKLKRAPTVNKNVKNERNYLFVFAKLSTITGATWLFGFVYMWTGIVAFSYIFTILNGSQGLFLMLSFVCNGRTVVMLKERSSSFKSSISGTKASNVHSAKGDVSCNSGHTG